MIVVSFNIGWFVIGPNCSSLEHLLVVIRPGVLLLQEYMILANSTCEFILKIKSTWKTCALAAIGLSCGTLIAWDSEVAYLKDFVTCAGILVEGKLKGFKE